MHSSTFSSNLGPGRRWLIALLAGVVMILGAAEWATRRVIIPSSRVLSRYEEEAWQAQTPDRGRRRLLICGNSMLADNVDFEALRHDLAPEWEAQRWSMDDTSYYDWLYALRRLTKRGHQPAAMVIMLAPFQVQMTRVRGTFFAHYLMAPEDWLDVAIKLSLHPTEAVGLAAATQSRFYAVQQDVRKTLAGRLMPFLPQLTARLIPARIPGTLSQEKERAIYIERLQELAGEGRKSGVRLLLALPAMREPSASETLLIESGRQVGLPVILGSASGSLPGTLYRDGLHMTIEGAAEYTPQFSKALRKELNGK